MKNFITLLSGIVIIFSIYSCNRRSGNIDSDESELSGSETVNTDTVELTNEQVKTAGIELGGLIEMKMGKEITTNGTIELQPNYKASINPPAFGFVSRINFMEGDHVKKGAILAILRHPDYIQMQQDFLDANGRYNYLKNELDRQKTLSEANVSALKLYQQTKADFEAARAKYTFLKEQLNFLGIDPELVLSGQIQNRISLYSPIDGNISQLKIHIGELISPSQIAFEIIDTSHILARLRVFEKDINNIHEGEKFVFSVPAFGDSIQYEGRVYTIDRMLDPETKTMDIIGSVKADSRLIPGLYIEAVIHSKESLVYALPDDAIVRDENKEFIFINNNSNQISGEGSIQAFIKIKVLTGASSGGFTQILNPDALMDHKNLVISGTYYLKAKMNVGEQEMD